MARVLFLSTPWVYVGGLEVLLHSFLPSVLDGDEWLKSPSRPRVVKDIQTGESEFNP